MSWTAERARHAALRRHRSADDPAVLDAQRDLRAARVEGYIREKLAERPPLTDDQIARLRALFPPASSAGAA